MASVTKITDHILAGLDRLREQWKEKTTVNDLIENLIAGMQDLEDTFFDLCEKRLGINEAEGFQLDQIGTIVGQERLGLSDEFYRILLFARVASNVSSGEPERVISTIKLLTQADFIHYMNLNNAELALGSDGDVDLVSADFLLRNMQRVVMGAVRINYICEYDKTEAFSMEGTNVLTPGAGFGTINDVNVGGKLGRCYNIKDNFSFDGNNTGDGGFGTIHDPLVGGVFE